MPHTLVQTTPGTADGRAWRAQSCSARVGRCTHLRELAHRRSAGQSPPQPPIGLTVRVQGTTWLATLSRTKLRFLMSASSARRYAAQAACMLMGLAARLRPSSGAIAGARGCAGVGGFTSAALQGLPLLRGGASSTISESGPESMRSPSASPSEASAAWRRFLAGSFAVALFSLPADTASAVAV